MLELTTNDIRSGEQLKSLGYSPDEIARYATALKQHGELTKKHAEAEETKAWDIVVDLEPDIDRLVKYLKYLGRHPKSIPIAELKELPKGADDSTEALYRDKVANPATAIRAFCIMCMGGTVSYVRECQAVSCVLWPFRTGKNPLRSKVLPPIDFDATIDPTEPLEEDTEEESDNEDADQL